MSFYQFLSKKHKSNFKVIIPVCTSLNCKCLVRGPLLFLVDWIISDTRISDRPKNSKSKYYLVLIKIKVYKLQIKYNIILQI